MRCVRTNCSVRSRNSSDDDDNGASKQNFFIQPLWSLRKSFSAQFSLFLVSYRWIPKLRKSDGSHHEMVNCSEEIRPKVDVPFVRLVVGVMLVMSLSVAISKTPSRKFIYFICELSSRFTSLQWLEHLPFSFICDYYAGALTEENLLFLEAWRTIDRAYVDKSFNGQSWFRYRENALRSEPMNTREETCIARFFLVSYS